MIQPYTSEEELEQKKKELKEILENTETYTYNSADFEEYNKQVKREHQERISYYVRETVQRPYYVDDDPKYFKGTKEHRKMIKRWRKWIKATRKKYVKYFKEWCPFDSSYLYNPIKMILKDMFEYYKRGDNVWGIPLITNEDGKITQQDTRKQTLAQALVLLETAEYEEEFGDYELSQQQFRIAFGYIAEHMKEWWD